MNAYCFFAPAVFQSNLHDKYGQLVTLYTKLLCTKMEFHMKVRACAVYHTICCNAKMHVMDYTAKCKLALINKKCTSIQHLEIPSSLEATDEVLERTAGTDINNV